MLNTKEYIPYTYIIGWSQYDKWYYGSRTANSKERGIANPCDLWVSYFTSSKIVARFREKYGEPDIIEIRRIFKTGDKAKQWEKGVLERIKYMSYKFLNQRYTGNTVILRGEFHPMYGKKHTLESRKKISNNHYDCSGSNNSRAKTFIIETPDNKKIICHGNLKNTCKQLGISFSTVRLRLLKGHKTKSGACVGYRVYEL